MPEIIHHLGCVSFLNSKPLIDPVLDRSDVRVHFAVPAKLLPLLQSGEGMGGVSTALMSVVDYHHADVLLLPAGMIGCDGPTLTVRIYSRIPIQQITSLHADTDSHTSVILAQLILRERFHLTPPLIPFAPTAHTPDTMLLIGDKVVNASPSAAEYPYQLDLGEEWKHLTGLPFVFAMWMIRRDALAQAPQIARILDDARRQGAGGGLTEKLLDRYAHEKGWPRDLARRYFTEYLRYEVTPAARQGLLRFFELAQSHHLLTTTSSPRKVEFFEIP